MAPRPQPIPLNAEQRALAETCVGLAYKFALDHFRKFGGDLDETRSAALLALVDAARCFKPELGWKFSTYAANVIFRRFQHEYARSLHPKRKPYHGDGSPINTISLDHALADGSPMSDALAELFRLDEPDDCPGDDRLDRVHAVMEKILTQRQHNAFRLALEGLSRKSIAKVLGVTRGQVNNLVTASVRRLRKHFVARPGNLP